MRGGKERSISTYDLLVGDVLLVDTGDILPADGLLFESSNLRCPPSCQTVTIADNISEISDSDCPPMACSLSPATSDTCQRHLQGCLLGSLVLYSDSVRHAAVWSPHALHTSVTASEPPIQARRVSAEMCVDLHSHPHTTISDCAGLTRAT